MSALSTNHAVVTGTPLVSVCMTAYNSAAWLARAIDSVLQQRTAFPIELVIGDDSSTDDTANVLASYREQHPQIIRVLNRTEKLGMQRNYFDTFERCRGKYIAWLDADDYWTDPEKLSMQVSVLEADESVSVCSHFVCHVTSTGEVIEERCPTMAPGRYGISEIIAENFVPSPSIMFRNGIHRSLPQSFFALTGLVDWPVLLRSALAGDIVLLDGIMANYVLTPGSAYMSKGPLYQDAIDLEFYDEMERMLPAEWQRSIRAAKGKRYEAMCHHLTRLGELSQARKAARQAFRVPDVMDNFFSKSKTLLSAEVLGRFVK